MSTITHRDCRALQTSPDTLTVLLGELAASDAAHVLRLAPIAVDQGECAFCDPTGPSGVVIATVAMVNRWDHLIRRTVCAGCVHEAVVWATGEGRDVTVRAAILPSAS